MVLAMRGDMIFRSRLAPAHTVDTGSENASHVDWVVTPDGRHALTIQDSGPIELRDATTGQLTARAVAPPATVDYAFTPDGRYLVVAEKDAVAVYTLPALAPIRRLALPEPDPDLLTPENMSKYETMLALTGPDRLAVLGKGILSWWAVSTGEQVVPPIPLTEGEVDGAYPAGRARLGAARPGHPSQVAVLRAEGRVEIWDLEQRRTVDHKKTSEDFHMTAAFDSTGRWLAVGMGPNPLVWDLNAHGDEPQMVPVGILPRPLGFASDSYLITYRESAQTIGVWDVGASLALAEVGFGGVDGSWALRTTRSSTNPSTTTALSRLMPGCGSGGSVS
jgi:WD40 repeat protein